MKRAPALVPLSREHNTALWLARAAKRAARSGNAERIQQAWQQLHDAWRSEMARHFRAEELLLFPVLREGGEHELVDLLLREHAAMHRTLEQPELQEAERLEALGQVLEGHVRREEREAFPRLEALLDQGSLTRLGHELARLSDRTLEEYTYDREAQETT